MPEWWDVVKLVEYFELSRHRGVRRLLLTTLA